MAKKYKGWFALEQALTDIKDSYDRELKATIKLLATQIRDMIQTRIVDGYGVKFHGARKVRIKDILPSTKQARKRKKLASYTAYNFSNQVETGRFVEGLKVKIKNNTIIISPSADREDMAAAQELAGRPTLYLSDEEIEFIMEELEKMLEDLWNP